MASVRRQVLLALKALVKNAVPDADVLGFDGDTSMVVQAGVHGTVVGYPGDPGDPVIDLSPPTHNYEHDFPIGVMPPAASSDPTGDMDAMMGAIGQAIIADRTLGGLCHWVEALAPEEQDQTPPDAATQHWAAFRIIAHYSTTDPLN